MEVEPTIDNPNVANVTIDNVQEEIAIVRAAHRNMSVLFAPLGLILANDVTLKVMETPEYPKELPMKRWQLALVADGMAKFMNEVDSFESIEYLSGLVGEIHQAGYGKHWSTPIIKSRGKPRKLK